MWGREKGGARGHGSGNTQPAQHRFLACERHVTTRQALIPRTVPHTRTLCKPCTRAAHTLYCPGESQELQLRYNPRALGDSVVLGVCDIEGSPQPTGFVVTSCIRGLQATYELLTPEQYEQYERLQAERAAGRVRRRRDDVDHFLGMSEFGRASRGGGKGGGNKGEGGRRKERRHGQRQNDVDHFLGVSQFWAGDGGCERLITNLSSCRPPITITSLPCHTLATPRYTHHPSHPPSHCNPLSLPTLHTCTAHLSPEVQAKYGLNKQGARAAGSRHLVADFGTAVPLGETRHMYLVVTNRTPIHTSVSAAAWFILCKGRAEPIAALVPLCPTTKPAASKQWLISRR